MASAIYPNSFPTRLGRLNGMLSKSVTGADIDFRYNPPAAIAGRQNARPRRGILILAFPCYHSGILARSLFFAFMDSLTWTHLKPSISVAIPVSEQTIAPSSGAVVESALRCHHGL